MIKAKLLKREVMYVIKKTLKKTIIVITSNSKITKKNKRANT